MSFSIFDLAQLAKRLTTSNGETSIRLMFNKGRYSVTDGTHDADAADLAFAFESLLTKMQEATQPQRNYTPSNAAAPHGCTACGLAQGRGLIGCAKHVNAGMAPARAAYAKLQGQTGTGTTTPNPSTIIFSSGGQVHNGRDWLHGMAGVYHGIEAVAVGAGISVVVIVAKRVIRDIRK